jgi:hypothetical protein
MTFSPPSSPAAAQAPAAPIAAGFGAGAFRPGGGMDNPVLLRMVEPFYTVEAAAHRWAPTGADPSALPRRRR